ncbi:hypothetical protein CDL15_Pgr000478 [Punica granatum]|uniref:Uncharacterized protein n=1 Tax=Punica granatum TaxID=22663 RepID=A0A218W312_PUNGR|nr:hypothetical protein CDL15_Pgr000478 [Punica granatum]
MPIYQNYYNKVTLQEPARSLRDIENSLRHWNARLNYDSLCLTRHHHPDELDGKAK